MTLVRRKLRALLASLGVALLSGGLSGCAGVVAIVRGSSDFQLEQAELSSRHRGIPARGEHLIGAFGAPDEIIALGPDRERWRYRTGLRFHGIALLLVVVPLPLLVPTGVHDTYVEIERGVVVRVSGSQNSDVARVGCMIGVLASLTSGDRRCFAKRGAPPKQAPLGSGVLWLGPPPSLEEAPSGPRRGGTRRHRSLRSRRTQTDDLLRAD